jgi:hypothetical protein
LRKLKAEAERIAAQIKTLERGEANDTHDPAGKIAAARAKPALKFGVVMDDKVLTIEMPWATIRTHSEAGLAEYILKHMRGSRDATH